MSPSQDPDASQKEADIALKYEYMKSLDVNRDSKQQWLVANEEGENIVSLGEAMDYTDEQVRRTTRNKQHPDTSGNFDRNLPLSVPH